MAGLNNEPGQIKIGLIGNMKSPNFHYRVLIFFLLLPLFFINVKDSHDWGDDFAQYLIQAKNIIEGKPQTANGLIYHPDDKKYAIEAYPVGMPLIMTPVYFFYELNIFPYNLLITCFLFFSGILFFEFLRRRISLFTALLLTLIYCYNFHILDLKKNILSEIPFTFMLLLFLNLIDSKIIKGKYSWAITGIILCITVSIRLAGIAVLLGYLAYEISFILKRKNKSEKISSIRSLTISIITASILYFFLNEIIFKVHSIKLAGFYSETLMSLGLQVKTNLSAYYHSLNYLFPFFGTYLPSFWILIPIAGWILHFYKIHSLSDFILGAYVLLLLLYPYSHSTIRFTLPVFPLLLYYMFVFLRSIFHPVRLKRPFQIALNGIFLILFVSEISPARGIINQQKSIEDGPQQANAKELFSWLKNTDSDIVIVFCKARAMSLYSEHEVLYPSQQQNEQETFIQFHRNKKLFIVVSKSEPGNEVYDQKMIDYISHFSSYYEKKWENDGFVVYNQLPVQ